MADNDIAIIGGGVIGTACAYYLAKAGHAVSVVEKNTVGSGASHANGGWLVQSHVVPLAAPKVIAQGLKWLADPKSPFYIRPRMSKDLTKWLWSFQKHCTESHVHYGAAIFEQLNAKTMELFSELSSKFEFQYEQRGLLDVFLNESKMKAAAKNNEKYAQFGVRTESLSRDALLALEPGLKDEVVGGFRFVDDAHVSPSHFVAGLRTLAQEHGARFIEETEVTDFVTEGDRITGLSTDGGDISAQHFILAAGAWSLELGKKLGVSLPVEAGKGYSITVDRPEGSPSYPMRLSEAKVAVTPLGDKLRFAGTLEISGMDTAVNHKRVQGILDGARKYLRVDGDWESVEPWAGLRPCTPDGLPILGWSPRFSNLMLATGHATVGLTLSTVTGWLVAELLAGRTPEIDISGLSAARFTS